MKKLCLFLFFFLLFGIKEEAFAVGTNVQPSCNNAPPCECDSSIKCNTDPCWFNINREGGAEFCSGHNMIWDKVGCYFAPRVTKKCCTSYAYVWDFRMYCNKCNQYFTNADIPPQQRREFWEYDDPTYRNPNNHNGCFGWAYAYIDDCAGCMLQTPIFNNGAVNHKGEHSQHRIACAYCEKDGVALGLVGAGKHNHTYDDGFINEYGYKTHICTAKGNVKIPFDLPNGDSVSFEQCGHYWYEGATITYDLNGGTGNISNQYNCLYQIK